MRFTVKRSSTEQFFCLNLQKNTIVLTNWFCWWSKWFQKNVKTSQDIFSCYVFFCHTGVWTNCALCDRITGSSLSNLREKGWIWLSISGKAWIWFSIIGKFINLTFNFRNRHGFDFQLQEKAWFWLSIWGIRHGFDFQFQEKGWIWLSIWGKRHGFDFPFLANLFPLWPS